MLLALLSTELPLLVLRLVDEAPEPEDVKAGWTAFAIFLLLAAAVAVLGLSLVKHLRRAESAHDAGLYGDEPVSRRTDDEPDRDQSTDDGNHRTTERP